MSLNETESKFSDNGRYSDVMKNRSNKSFVNTTFFIFPLLIEDREALNGYLSAGLWRKWNEPSAFHTIYILSYADRIQSSGDGRMTKYALDKSALPQIYMFENELRKSDFVKTHSGISPTLDSVSLYLFSSGVAFLEFCVLFEEMSTDEIQEFIYYFRSLRHNKNALNENNELRFSYPEKAVDLQTAIEAILPQESAGVKLCFSNESEVKRQAIVYSIVEANENDGEETIEQLSYRLSHGIRLSFTVDLSENRSKGGDDSEKYVMYYYMSPGSYWTGSQDGLACVVKKRYYNQFGHMIFDYHYAYLLLLNQRFSSFHYIGEFSREFDKKTARQEISEINRKVVDLKTRFAFRVISDDRNVQTVYQKMYSVLELDDLLKDLEDANARLAELQQEEIELQRTEYERKQQENEEREKKLNKYVLALSFLAVFSALVDLAQYLSGYWDIKMLPFVIASFVVIAAIIVFWVLRIYRNGGKK